MDPWVWLVAYLVGFTLLQLLLYRYVSRDVPQGESATPASPEGATPSPARPDRPTADGEVACTRCGTINQREPTYRFCRECLAPLSGNATG